MMRLLVIFAAANLLISCGRTPKIDYNEKIDTTSVIDDRIRDTTKILVSELPVKFDSTDMLLSAIELVDLQGRDGYSKLGSSSYGNTDIASSYFNSDNLVGNFINLVFQDKNGLERKLTNKKIQIRSVNFLRATYRRTNVGYLLYLISDRDSNGDKELTHSDLEALYISKLDGSDFKKLTKELHEFYDWSLVNDKDRIYFRTLEDQNKDGELNNQDKFHYYFIDFFGEKYSVTEYNPLKIFE